tara:strand:- start:1190 stop:2068 length:879 start_codon:yes stop_codon:yes gene_type:complete
MCLKHLDLCSGIGGFALGLQSTGCFKTIGFCEIDPFCQKVLKKNFPGVPIYNDIKEFKPNDEGLRPDVITSGFPCQPFSVAGKQQSKKDNRNLWKETHRVIQESRPAWFIGENVNGIVKLYLDTILEDLENSNYSTRCFNISAQSIGASHQRQRIWIVANSNSINSKEVRRCSKADEKIGGTRSLHKRTSGSDDRRKFNSKKNGEMEYVSDSDIIGTQVQTEGKHAAEQMFGINGEENWWQTFSKFHRIPDGISTGLDKDRANRIKGLGNAIVPQIPFYIGQAIGRLYEISQ